MSESQQPSVHHGIRVVVFECGFCQVRTIQEPEAEEQVHQVFSSRGASWEAQATKAEAWLLDTSRVLGCGIHLKNLLMAKKC